MAGELYVEAGYVNDNYVSAGVFVDWAAKIIHVPRTYMLLVQSNPEVRELGLNQFRLDLKALEAGEYGISYLDTHQHNPPVTVGGVTLARVVEIINGYTITFEDGQYAVNVQGGNSNVSDVVNPNQVSVRSANSAGLTYSKEIEDQSFLDGRIWIDTLYGLDGSQYPRGTTAEPTSSYDYAEQIIADRQLPHRFWLNGVQLLHAHETETDHSDWLGSSPVTATLVLAGVITSDYVIRRIAVTGVGNGNFSLQDGVLQDVSNFEGDASNSGIGGSITLPNKVMTELITFHDCFSIVPGNATPILDCNDATNVQAQFRGYTGGIEVRNYSSADNNMSIDVLSGHVKLDSSCTDGVIVIRGTGRLTDNSNGATVVTKGFTPVWTEEEKDATLVALTSIADTITLLQKYQENRQVIDKDANTLTIYDDDDVTPILVFSLLNTLGAPSTDEVAERVPQ